MQPALAAGAARRRRPGRRQSRASATWCTPPRCSPRTPPPTGRRCVEYVAEPVRRDRAGRPLAGRPRAATGPRRWSTSCCAGSPTTRAGCSRSSRSSPCGSTTRAAPIELTGRVDRLEVDDEGRLVVIDLKTGKSHPGRPPTWPSTRSSPATRRRSRRARSTSGDESGGAALVQLGADRQGRAGAGAAAAGRGRRPAAGRTTLVRRTADGMAASTFARRRQQPVPGLPGAHRLPDLRQGPAGRTSRDMTQHEPVRRRPGPHRAASRRRAPVHAGRAGQAAAAATRRRRSRPRSSRRRSSRCWWSPAPVGQDRDDGRAGGLAGRQRLRPPRADPRPHLHPQGRRRAGPPHPAAASASWCGGSAATTQLAGEPTVSTYHSYAARVVTEHGLRAGYEPSDPAAHRGRLLAARRLGGAHVRRRHDRRRRRAAARSPTPCCALAGELAEHLRHPGRAWPRWTGRFFAEVQALPGTGLQPTCRRCSTASRPGCSCCRWSARTPSARPTLEAMDFGDQLRPRGPGGPRPPRGRRDRAGPLPGRAARRVPGHQPRPGGAAAARCSAAATR